MFIELDSKRFSSIVKVSKLTAAYAAVSKMPRSGIGGNDILIPAPFLAQGARFGNIGVVDFKTKSS